MRQLNNVIKTENLKKLEKNQRILKVCVGNINKLDNKCKLLQKRFINLDRYSRKNNIIFGVSIAEPSNIISVASENIKELINVDHTVNDINNLYQIKD